MTVNALRKASSDEEVISTAKQLIKNWKKFVPGMISSECLSACVNEIYVYLFDECCVSGISMVKVINPATLMLICSSLSVFLCV